jgi:hypothetical protein
LMAADAAIKKHSSRLNSPSEPDWHCKCWKTLGNFKSTSTSLNK